MKKIIHLLFVLMLFLANSLMAQVATNFNNEILISSKGQFGKDYRTQIDFEIPAKNSDNLLATEKQDIKQSNEVKPFKLAIPVSIDLDIAKLTSWTYDNEFAYGKFTIKLNRALSVSINFDRFYLPKNTEIFVYNENGNMITGAITERENNPNKLWGSWVYQGEFITIEIKTPTAAKNQLLLHSNNVAYGYKEIYKSIKVGGFGQSGPCNINVICPLGIGWEGERNTVSTILSANGGEFCTGSLIMNTCATNQPYYLTANHCFNGNSNTSGWRFAFQAWSTTCPNPGVNTNGVMYNGATLRARNAASDFCLVELNTTPSTNSGLHYAGWTTSNTPAQNATGIHHPSGDLMKISRANNAVTVASFAGTTNQHWRSNWSPQNNGAGQIVTAITEGGSSGSPLFDQDHRIIGQLHGGPSFCGSTQPWDFYGRFDLSWTGGGTNATRLSNWLDPSNSGAITTNTTNVAALLPAPIQGAFLPMTGNNVVCGNSETYTISGLPPGATVVWELYGPTAGAYTVPLQNVCTLAASGNQATLTKQMDGNVNLFATITNCGGVIQYASKPITFGTPSVYYNGGYATNRSYYQPITGTVNLIDGYAIYASLANTTNNTYYWQYNSSQSNPSWYNSGNGHVNITFPRPMYSGSNINFTVNTSNACGSRTDPVVFYYYGPPIYYRVSPNPANDVLKIEEIGKPTNKAVAQTNIRVIEIIDKMGILVYRKEFAKGTPNGITIPVGHLRNDFYSIRIFDGKEWKSQKIIIQH